MPQQENWQPTGPHATRMSPQIHYRHTRHGIARNQFSSLMDQTKCLTKFSKRVYRLEFDLAVIEDFLKFVRICSWQFSFFSQNLSGLVSGLTSAHLPAQVPVASAGHIDHQSPTNHKHSYLYIYSFCYPLATRSWFRSLGTAKTCRARYC